MLDYALLDSGDGQKLERFGNNVIQRPEEQATWKPNNPIALWDADAVCTYRGNNRYQWSQKTSFHLPWHVRYDGLVCELRLSHSKNMGLFPEQEKHWKWLKQQCGVRTLSVLNLFAYTGMASLVCCKAGAEVTHVDASRSTVAWAAHNAMQNGLSGKIRWIVDDAVDFLRREVNRKRAYDLIIMDPPPFGIASRSKHFRFNKEIHHLLQLSKELLVDSRGTLLINSYGMHWNEKELKNAISIYFNGHIQSGSLYIDEQTREKKNFLQYFLFCIFSKR